MYQPYINSAKASLDYLNSEELKDLLNDDAKLDQKVVDSVATLEKEKEEMIVQNRLTAEENLEKEPKLHEVRTRVIDLTEQGKVLGTKINEKLNAIKIKSGGMSQETALALLQTAGAEKEEESEKLVKKLLANEVTIDEFLDQFMQIRKLMHSRKLKADKMTELLRHPGAAYRNSNFNRQPGYPPPSTGFYPAVTNPPGGGHVPYPMGNIVMPMPNNNNYRPF